ncbi:MAG: RNA polymerase sigma factor [Desulfuromonadales bacterium]|nr:RNA polymerase sigma factor [Desulfuromonadales bacterium]
MNVIDSESSDDYLIQEIRAGNSEAFGHLVRRHKRKVFALAARFARDADDLDDICQDVFIKIYENLDNFRADAPFEHWLSRVTTRTCYDALRSRKREMGNVSIDSFHNLLKDTSYETLQAAEEARNILKWGLDQLRPEERLVITLLELEENTIKEIADMTGWSQPNVKIRAFRARQKLKQVLEKQYER